jgi:hypothetical protein
MGLLNTFQNVAQTAMQNTNNQNRPPSTSNGNTQQSQIFVDFLSNAIPSLSNSWPQIITFSSQIGTILMQNLVNSGQSFRRATEA